MLRIVKENASMIVSQEDFDLIYKNAGWEVAEDGADVQLPEDNSRRIEVNPNTETVAGPTPLILESNHEGETILEDMNENRTQLGREEDAEKPKVNGKPNLDRNKK